MDITVPLLANESVHRATVVVLLNYTLDSYIKMNMDALAMYTHDSAAPGEVLYVDGDMTLQMRRPLVVTKSYVTICFTNHLLALSRCLPNSVLSVNQDAETVRGLAAIEPLGDPDAPGLAAGEYRCEVSRPRLYVVQRVSGLVCKFTYKRCIPQTWLCSRRSTLCGEPTRARTRALTPSAAFKCK